MARGIQEQGRRNIGHTVVCRDPRDSIGPGRVHDPKFVYERAGVAVGILDVDADEGDFLVPQADSR